MSVPQTTNTDWVNQAPSLYQPKMHSVSIFISSCSASYSTMSSSDGKWAEPKMLDIIRRAVQHQAMTLTERQQLEEFLDIPSQTSVAESRPPSYTEDQNQGHGAFHTLPIPQPEWSDTGSSLRRTSTNETIQSSLIRTSTHGTNQTGSSGLSDRGQQSDTGSPRASRSGSAHSRQQPRTGSPQASVSASAHRRQRSSTLTHSPQASSSSGSSHQERTNLGVGPGHPGAEGDFHHLLLPDPRREGGR